MKWSVESYKSHANYVSKHGLEVLALLAPKSGEQILDIGCGEGELAQKIAAYGCDVIATDSSDSMIAAAKQRGLDARVIGAEELDFTNRFDAVFSNAALHWMKDPDKVIANVYRALKKGGRFCAEFGAHRNVAAIVDELHTQLAKRGLDAKPYNPWYFPEKDAYCLKLEAAGFVIESAEVFDRPTLLPTNVAGWLETFADPFLVDIPINERRDFILNVASALEDKLKAPDGSWFADYVRLRFLALKTSGAKD